MGSIADFLENKLLDHVMGVASYTPAAAVYLGLSTADPTDDASGLAEPTGNGYARKAITFAAAASRSVTQNATVTFDQASGAWGTITHYGVFDAVSGGNMLAHGSLNDQKEVVNGNTPSVASGEVVISLSAGAISTYLANELLDHAFRNAAYSQPTIYVALSTANPKDDFSGLAEPTGNNYARKAHSAWEAAAGGATENTGVIQFNTPSGSWGAITYAAIIDALTGGNGLLYAAVSQSQTPGNGDDVEFPDGDLDITLT